MKTLKAKLQKRINTSVYVLAILVAVLGLSILLESCSDKCTVTNEYVYYEPVYTTLESIRTGLSLENPQPIRSVGKIYLKDNFLFVNEPGEGIHIIDDNDPSNPVNKKFLKIPGNYDLAISGNVLYADSYVDLVVIDISDVQAAHEIERLENFFGSYNSLGFYADEARGVVTEWVEKSEVNITESECEVNLQPWGGYYYAGGIAMLEDAAASFNSKAAIAPGNGSGPGLGGSLARFAISLDHLYILDGSDLRVVDVSTETNPQIGTRQSVSWDIETIFPYSDKLFIGSRSGMHIFDISSPESPSLVSTYAHVSSCDPVVVDGDYAYVTLRSGNPTYQGFSNQLEVIDIKDLSNPQLLETYSMTNPHGLGIDDNILFICDGDAGLKVYDASDIHSISDHLLAAHKNINAYDVIPYNNVLIMIGDDGIFQYNYANPEKITLLSHIKLEKSL